MAGIDQVGRIRAAAQHTQVNWRVTGGITSTVERFNVDGEWRSNQSDATIDSVRYTSRQPSSTEVPVDANRSRGGESWRRFSTF